MFIYSKLSTDLIFPTKSPSRVTQKSYFLLDQYFPRQLVNLSCFRIMHLRLSSMRLVYTMCQHCYFISTIYSYLKIVPLIYILSPKSTTTGFFLNSKTMLAQFAQLVQLAKLTQNIQLAQFNKFFLR